MRSEMQGFGTKRLGMEVKVIKLRRQEMLQREREREKRREMKKRIMV
jgi:hypothetical protein